MSYNINNRITFPIIATKALTTAALVRGAGLFALFTHPAARKRYTEIS